MMRFPAAPAFSTPMVPLIISILALTTATLPSALTDHGNDVYDYAETLYRKLDFLECTGCTSNKNIKGNCTVYGTMDHRRYLKLLTFYEGKKYVDLVDVKNPKSINSCLVSKYLIWHVNFLLQPYKDSFRGAIFNFTRPLSKKNLSNIELNIQNKAELFDLLKIKDLFMVIGKDSNKLVNNTDTISDYFNKFKQGSSENTYFSGNTTHFESFQLPTVVVDGLKNCTETIEKIESNVSQVYQALVEDLESKNSNLSKTIEDLESKNSNLSKTIEDLESKKSNLSKIIDDLESKKSNPFPYKIIAIVTISVLAVMIFSIVILAVMLVKEKKSKFKVPAADQNRPTSIIINAGNDARYQ